MYKLVAFVGPRRGFALIGLAAVGLVVAFVVLTRMLDLAPCPLCVFQRMLYVLLAVLALVATVWPPRRLRAGVLARVTTLGGLATAIYQSWTATADRF